MEDASHASNYPANGTASLSGGSSEQLDDECQLWVRALRQLSARPTLDQPPRSPAADRVTWTTRGICLPLALSRRVRTTLLELCAEADERQTVIDRLSESEGHLRADLRYSQEKMQLYREKLAAVQQKSSLDSARSSTMAFPDSESLTLTLSNNREQELLTAKSVASSRAKALESKVESQAAEIVRLRRKLQDLERVESERHQRQQEVFRSLKSRKPTRHSPLDNKMLDIIDGYETQLQRLRMQLQGGGDFQESVTTEADSAAPGKGYRLTIEQLNRQVTGLSDQVTCLENEREVLCAELESRPTSSDHVLLVSKLQRYERLLRKHNVDASKEAAAAPRDFSTRLEDVDLLPLSLCQKFLKEAARLLEVQDLRQMRDCIADLVSISEAYGVAHQILVKAQSLVFDETAPPLPSELAESLVAGSDRAQLLIPALVRWRDQLASLPELQQSLERLFQQLYPWATLGRLQAGPDVPQLIAAVDRMASDENYELAPPLRQDDGNSAAEAQPPYSMLRGLVEHFRKLFDVDRLPGVCTKMNSVYSELGVCRNAMNSIKEALGLVEQTPMEAVVNAVARLMQLERLSVNDKLQEIFSHEDVQLTLDRLDEYDQFFPVFEELVKNLMAILGVARVDEILPTVTAHKRAFDSQE